MKFTDIRNYRRSILSDCILAHFILKEIQPEEKSEICILYNSHGYCPVPALKVGDKVYTRTHGISYDRIEILDVDKAYNYVSHYLYITRGITFRSDSSMNSDIPDVVKAFFESSITYEQCASEMFERIKKGAKDLLHK